MIQRHTGTLSHADFGGSGRGEPIRLWDEAAQSVERPGLESHALVRRGVVVVSRRRTAPSERVAASLTWLLLLSSAGLSEALSNLLP